MMSDIAIRPARPEELPLLEELARRIWPDTYGKLLPPGQIDYMIEAMYSLPVIQKELTEGVTFDLICDGETPIGFISLGPCEEKPGVLKLHKLYLDFAWHGRGIGQLALRHALDAAKAQGSRFLRLNVNKNNVAALKAYRRAGFYQADAVKVDIGSGFVMDDFIMEAEIK